MPRVKKVLDSADGAVESVASEEASEDVAAEALVEPEPVVAPVPVAAMVRNATSQYQVVSWHDGSSWQAVRFAAWEVKSSLDPKVFESLMFKDYIQAGVLVYL